MKYKFHIADIVLLLFVLTTLGDIVSTIMSANKHTIDLETNPLMVTLGLPLWGLFVLKVLFMGLLFFITVKRYTKTNIYIRYYLVLFICLITLLQLAVTVHNFEIYNMPVEDVEPLPKELRADAYKEGVGNMKAVKSIEPTIKTIDGKKVEIPLMAYLVILNLIVFAIWVSFEKKYNMGCLK